MISLIHCEDHALMQDAAAQLKGQGIPLCAYFPEVGPCFPKWFQPRRAVAFAEATNAPIYIVHLSSRRALDVCAEAKHVTCRYSSKLDPLYLHLTSELLKAVDGAKYVGQPPLREQATGCALGRYSARCNRHSLH